MKELTAAQIERQDSVDNAIYQLIRKINPSDKDIAWDIEMIGNVRDVVREENGWLRDWELQISRIFIRGWRNSYK